MNSIVGQICVLTGLKLILTNNNRNKQHQVSNGLCSSSKRNAFDRIDLQEQIDRLQSIVVRLASNIESINQQSDRSSSPSMNLHVDIKQELTEEVCTEQYFALSTVLLVSLLERTFRTGR